MSRIASISMTDSEFAAVEAAAEVAHTTVSGIIRDSLRRAGYKMARRVGDPEPSREQRIEELRRKGDPVFRCDGCGLEFAATTAKNHTRGGITSQFMVVGGKTLCEDCQPRYRRRQVSYVPVEHRYLGRSGA